MKFSLLHLPSTRVARAGEIISTMASSLTRAPLGAPWLPHIMSHSPGPLFMAWACGSLQLFTCFTRWSASLVKGYPRIGTWSTLVYLSKQSKDLHSWKDMERFHFLSGNSRVPLQKSMWDGAYGYNLTREIKSATGGTWVLHSLDIYWSFPLYQVPC